MGSSNSNAVEQKEKPTAKVIRKSEKAYRFIINKEYEVIRFDDYYIHVLNGSSWASGGRRTLKEFCNNLVNASQEKTEIKSIRRKNTYHLLLDKSDMNDNNKIWNGPIHSLSDQTLITLFCGFIIVTEVCKYKINTNTMHSKITCPEMRQKNTNNPLKCSVYYDMKMNYQWIQRNLDHLDEYTHFKSTKEKPECKHKNECFAFRRLQNNSEIAFDDLCHAKLHCHPPRERNIALSNEVHPFISNTNLQKNHPLYEPTEDDYKIFKQMKKNKFHDSEGGWLVQLIAEVERNGFGANLGEDHSLINVVLAKMNCKKHKMMGMPLNCGEMLSLLLYTGCSCNMDLCKSQREGDYNKWKWFDKILFEAITKLALRQTGQFPVYSGLHQIKFNKKEIKDFECGYFVTYVSTSWDKKVAEFYMCEKGMMLEFDEKFRAEWNKLIFRSCDVSWISRFEDEAEILFARSVGSINQFQYKILEEQKEIQIVSVSPMMKSLPMCNVAENNGKYIVGMRHDGTNQAFEDLGLQIVLEQIKSETGRKILSEVIGIDLQSAFMDPKIDMKAVVKEVYRKRKIKNIFNYFNDKNKGMQENLFKPISFVNAGI
eukprot:324719_1